MEIGKLPESVLKRSVFKQLHTTRPEVLQGAGVGEDCAALELAEGEIFVVSTDPITAAATDAGKLAIRVTLNDLATTGAEPVAVLVTALLTPEMTEPEIRKLIAQMEEECAKSNVQIVGGHTEVTDVVRQPLLSITGIGKVQKDRYLLTGGSKAGDDIIVTKWIGLEGTSIIAKEKEEKLSERLSKDLIRTGQAFDQYLSILPEAKTAAESGAHAMHDITEGGVFGALWEVAEAAGLGLDIDLLKIPVRQETIEVCEVFGINPYELISSGSLLVTTPDGTGLIRALEDAGISAAIIGKMTEGNDRIIRNGEDRRYLEPPKTDEIYKVI